MQPTDFTQLNTVEQRARAVLAQLLEQIEEMDRQINAATDERDRLNTHANELGLILGERPSTQGRLTLAWRSPPQRNGVAEAPQAATSTTKPKAMFRFQKRAVERKAVLMDILSGRKALRCAEAHRELEKRIGRSAAVSANATHSLLRRTKDLFVCDNGYWSLRDESRMTGVQRALRDALLSVLVESEERRKGKG